MMSSARKIAKSVTDKSGSKMERVISTVSPFRVAALYHFSKISEPLALQPTLLRMCQQNQIRGTLLLANEGINGTIAGPDHNVDKVIQYIKEWEGFGALEVKYSMSVNGAAFHHMRIKVKPEIVTMGKPDIDPVLGNGTYVEPKDWNALISRPDVALIDTRNDYEVMIGKFKGAINPETETFKDFPSWAERLVSDKSTSEPIAPKAMAMYCTGGIRCEKATAYMKKLGVQEVYHLKGGILKYLEEVPEAQSMWEGECFVFDERVGIKHGLELGEYISCHACGRGVSPEGQKSPNYVAGVSCDYCIDEYTENDRERFRQRQLQIKLAKERGEVPMGPDAQPHMKRQARDAEEA